MSKTVDSYRFTPGITKRIVRSWITLEAPRAIPWTPLSLPLSESTVALVSSGGIAMKTDQPFDQEGERKNPWWGDPSYRIIPRDATGNDIKVYHLHINPSYAEQDLNCLLPTARLLDLERSGEIGSSAPSHYSIMGYILNPKRLLEESAPAIIRTMQDENVDVVVLIPA